MDEAIHPEVDRQRAADLVHVSRNLDALEEATLVPEEMIFCHFNDHRVIDGDQTNVWLSGVVKTIEQWPSG